MTISLDKRSACGQENANEQFSSEVLSKHIHSVEMQM